MGEKSIEHEVTEETEVGFWGPYLTDRTNRTDGIANRQIKAISAANASLQLRGQGAVVWFPGLRMAARMAGMGEKSIEHEVTEETEVGFWGPF